MSNVKCVACDSDMESDYFIQKNFRFSVPEGYSPEIVHCKSCGLRRLHPLLTQSQYDQVYSEAYFQPDSQDMAGHHYQGSCHDRIRVYKSKIKRLQANQPGKKSILDIGAGEGDFLSVAQEYFDIYGVEYSEHGVNAAHEKYGISVKRGRAEQVGQLFDQKFDVIHMHHVFEHLVDPGEFLLEIVKKMHSDSLFTFEVPYQFESVHEWVRNRIGLRSVQEGLFAVHHPFFYTPKAIKCLLKKYGLQVVFLTTAPRERAMVVGDNLLKSVARLPLFALQRALQRGPVIEVIARKMS